MFYPQNNLTFSTSLHYLWPLQSLVTFKIHMTSPPSKHEHYSSVNINISKTFFENIDIDRAVMFMFAWLMVIFIKQSLTLLQDKENVLAFCWQNYLNDAPSIGISTWGFGVLPVIFCFKVLLWLRALGLIDALKCRKYRKRI